MQFNWLSLNNCSVNSCNNQHQECAVKDNPRLFILLLGHIGHTYKIILDIFRILADEGQQISYITMYRIKESGYYNP